MGRVAHRVARAGVDADAIRGGTRDDVGVDDELALLAGQVGVAAKSAVGCVGVRDEPLVGVERAEHRHVSRGVVRRLGGGGDGIIGASADLELIRSLKRLGRSPRRSAHGEDAGGRCWVLSRSLRCRHHLTTLGEANNDVVDVEALKLVVLATLGAFEIAGRVGETGDGVDAISVGIDLRGIKLTGRVKIEPEANVGVAGPLPQIHAGLPPVVGVEEFLDVLVGVLADSGRGRTHGREFRVGRVCRGERGVVGCQKLPGGPLVYRDQHAGAVSHFVDRARSILGV